jgi:hypothetical protein
MLVPPKYNKMEVMSTMKNIVMNNGEFEDIVTIPFKFYAPADERDAIMTARQVEKLAIHHDVYCDVPENTERYYRYDRNKSVWSILVKGTWSEVGAFKDYARDIVREVR